LDLAISFTTQRLTVPTLNTFQEVVVQGVFKSITGPSPRRNRIGGGGDGGGTTTTTPAAHIPKGINTEWNHNDETRTERRRKRQEKRERRKHKGGWDDVSREEVVEMEVEGHGRALRGSGGSSTNTTSNDSSSGSDRIERHYCSRDLERQ